MMLWRGFRTGKWLPMGATLVWANMAFWVLLSSIQAMLYVWIFVPLFFHATQHWGIAWVTYQKEKQKEGKLQSSDLFKDICQVTLPIQALTIVVLFLPMFFTDISKNISNGIDVTLSMEWSMFVFYLHYFADRVVWRANKNKEQINVIKAI